MTIKAIALSLIGFGLLLTASAHTVNAQSCTTSYGGATTCLPGQLVLIKDVKNPITNGFVKNLSTADATFSPDGEVLFRLTIKNTGNAALDKVTVKDTFPQYLTFEAGPGSYNTDAKILTFTLDNLLAGETRQVEIMAKIDKASAFASNRNFFCVVNDALAVSGNQKSEDTAQLCIQTQVLGATTLPVAGYNDWILILPFLAVAGMGLALAKIKA